MAASITLFNSFNLYRSNGTIDLDTDVFKIALTTSTYVPAATQTVYANVTNELATANGYTAGGLIVASTFTQATNVVTWDLADATWNATGAGITARYAVCYKAGTANAIVNPLCFWVLLNTSPADVVTAAGNPFTIQWNASGIFSEAI